MVNPYIESRFWQAYAELYWPDLDSNTDLSKFGSALADVLPKRNSDEPVTILLLGFGFGGVELPVLYHLKKRLKELGNTRLRCICIDQALPPMQFAQHLVRSGLEQLPKTAEAIVAKFAEFAPLWQKEDAAPEGRFWLKTPDGDEFHFVQDDLNWESKTEVFPPIPSMWHERLNEVLPRSQKADLVFGAFSLFHIGWWRSVLMHSLGRLKADGLFLHGKVEGDEGLFEGRPGLQDSQNTLATDFFLNGFFSNRQVQDISQKPRAASASQPFVIEAFLSRLQAFGLKQVRDLATGPEGSFPDRYIVSPKVGLNVYSALLETQGFGTFRYIAEELEKLGSDYNKICWEFQQKYRSRIEKDVLCIPFQWTVWRLANSQALKAFPLFHRLRQESCPPPQNQAGKALHDSYVAAYELSSPLGMHEQLDDVKRLAGRLGCKINQQGLLHDDCLALEFGLDPQQGERVTWSFFGSALHNNHSSVSQTLQEVALYLMLLAERSKRSGFSNTKTLLEVIVPLFQKAPLFVYDLEQTEYTFTHQAQLHFEEFRFTVPTLAPETKLAWDDARNQLKLRPTVSYPRPPNRDHPDVFTVKDFDRDEEALGKLFEYISHPDQHLKHISKQLKDSFNCQSHLRQDVRENITHVIDDQMAFTVRCLKLLSAAKQVVFFPARYELGKNSISKDVAIAIYARRLSKHELSNEFLKFDHIFQQIKQKRTAVEGEERGRDILQEEFAHEVKHAARAISSRWLTPPAAIQEMLSQKSNMTLKGGHTLREVVEVAHSALVPDLFDHAARVFRLWSAASVEDLVSDETFPEHSRITAQSQIADLILLANALSVSNKLLKSAKGLELSSISALENARLQLRKLDLAKQQCKVAECDYLLSYKKNFSEGNALDFVRLFVSLFTNFRRHGKHNSGLTCYIEPHSVSRFVKITLQNEAREEFEKANQGLEVISKLARRLGGTYSPKPMFPLFFQELRLPADHFDISPKASNKK